MSRFDHKYYKAALESPPSGRSYIACCWEKPLWKRWNHPKRFLFLCVIWGLAGTMFIVPVLSLLFKMVSPKKAGITLFASGAIILSVGIIRTVYMWAVGKQNAKSRKNMDFTEFLREAKSLELFNSNEVKIVRGVLGFVYTVPSEIIYPDDQGESLALLGELYEPYVFELVLGVANRLNIKLSDSEIDSIIKSIYGKAKDVEELVSILLHELNNIRHATYGTDLV